jgi:hypothetical protein
MSPDKLVQVYESAISEITIVETDGFKFSFVPDRVGVLTRRGRVFDGPLCDLLLVEVEGHDN